MSFDWIINDDEIAAPSGDGTANAGSKILSAFVVGPVAGGLAFPGERKTKSAAVLGNELAHSTAPTFGQLVGVTASQDALFRMQRHVPRREQATHVDGFAAGRRCKDHQAGNLTAGYCLQLFNEQSVMRCRCQAAGQGVLAPFQEAVPDGTAFECNRSSRGRAVVTQLLISLPNPMRLPRAGRSHIWPWVDGVCRCLPVH